MICFSKYYHVIFVCYSYTLSSFHFLYLILSHIFIQKKIKSLLWLFLYLTFLSISFSFSPLELLDLFISPINYLIFPFTSLSLSPLEFPTSSSPQLIAPPISYLNLMVRIFFSLPVLPMDTSYGSIVVWVSKVHSFSFFVVFS